MDIRAPANAISTTANWIFNFMVVMVTPVAFAHIKYNTYTVFAVINAFMVPCVYFFFPETAYRSLEEMGTYFQGENDIPQKQYHGRTCLQQPGRSYCFVNLFGTTC